MSATVFARYMYATERRRLFLDGWRAGFVPAALLAFAALAILAGGVARAGSLETCPAPAVAASEASPGAASIVLASLAAGDAAPSASAAPITTRRIVPVFGDAAGTAIEAAPIVVAGRCGSSQYSCTSPGFTYCCGNSTDGFYCAADVNGCTK